MPPHGSQQHSHSVSLGPQFLIISETWNRANHWITEHKAKCRSCMWICLTSGKGKCTRFLKNLRIAVHCGRIWQNSRLWEIKRQICGKEWPVQLPQKMKSVKMSWHSSPPLPLNACALEKSPHTETLHKSKDCTIHMKTLTNVLLAALELKLG